MKINFIVNEQDQNSILDANILSFLFKKNQIYNRNKISKC